MGFDQDKSFKQYRDPFDYEQHRSCSQIWDDIDYEPLLRSVIDRKTYSTERLVRDVYLRNKKHKVA